MVELPTNVLSQKLNQMKYLTKSSYTKPISTHPKPKKRKPNARIQSGLEALEQTLKEIKSKIATVTPEVTECVQSVSPIKPKVRPAKPKHKKRVSLGTLKHTLDQINTRLATVTNVKSVGVTQPDKAQQDKPVSEPKLKKVVAKSKLKKTKSNSEKPPLKRVKKKIISNSGINKAAISGDKKSVKIKLPTVGTDDPALVVEKVERAGGPTVIKRTKKKNLGLLNEQRQNEIKERLRSVLTDDRRKILKPTEYGLLGQLCFNPPFKY